MKTYITLPTVLLVGISLICATARTNGQGPERQRTVVKKPWRLEPVSVVAIKTKNKEYVETGQAFEEGDEWLDGFTVTVGNNYHKAVTALSVAMVFPKRARRP